MNKSSVLIFLVIFSLLLTSLTAFVDDQSKHARKLIYKQSVRASSDIRATLLLTNLEKDGDSGGLAVCDGQLDRLNELITVVLPSKWYNNGKSCNKGVSINYNGQNVTGVVVAGCDPEDEGYCTDDIVAVVVIECSPPDEGYCTDRMVDASKAFWKGLQVPESEWGNEIQVTWSFLD